MLQQKSGNTNTNIATLQKYSLKDISFSAVNSMNFLDNQITHNLDESLKNVSTVQEASD